jgi:hypothetical protein
MQTVSNDADGLASLLLPAGGIKFEKDVVQQCSRLFLERIQQDLKFQND